MKAYSEMWNEPSRENGLLMACDVGYQWMALAACIQARKFLGGRCDLEVWTWGPDKFCDRVSHDFYRLDARVCQILNTGQYCGGWEARHHAMCLTKYRRVMMIDVDTYINDPLADAFQDYDEDMWLYAADSWSSYTNPEFAGFFDLPPKTEGYVNYDIHFGIYDRCKPNCRNVLTQSSDLLGLGPQCYGQAKVVGDQDIRNGLIHKLGASVKPGEYRSDGFAPLSRQMSDKGRILHHMGGDSKARDEAGFVRLMQLLDGK
ncbi:MAG: hypothetical protein JWL69_4784 [Phycisphaerales bacterium]|nr:hypothetical protein [Phycisphaerales bacterium]MDB5357911.1 hypothetical protein [Phycisphaerales bacterium]